MAIENRPNGDAFILHVAPFRTVRPVSCFLYVVRLEVRILPPQSFSAAFSLGFGGCAFLRPYPSPLGQIDRRVASVSADGAYDTERVYKDAQSKGEGRAVRVLIPPERTPS